LNDPRLTARFENSHPDSETFIKRGKIEVSSSSSRRARMLEIDSESPMIDYRLFETVIFLAVADHRKALQGYKLYLRGEKRFIE
jgi:hypothetical protein